MSQKGGFFSKLLRIFTGPAEESAPKSTKKTCVLCANELTGRQRLYCSKNCASKAYYAKKKAA